MINDTIAAVSTARGTGGIAVIRISGDDALKLTSLRFSPANKTDFNNVEPRKAIFGYIYNSNKEILDSGIATFFKGPNSFTGEDIVEISCHGGIAVTQAVLEAFLEAGCKMAEPGEFTKRAFINGKLTLSEAEAVGNLISADTYSKMALASSASRGILSNKIDELYNKLLNVMTALYAAIDYPEEDVGDEGEKQILSTVTSVASEVSSLIETYKSGHAISYGIKTVICGSPNSGKSSLYNAMLGEDKAIVTNYAGTTRDILEDSVSCGGATLLLTDTAGLRTSTNDEIEKIGIKKALDKIEEAELIIAVYDGGRELNEEEIEFISTLKQKHPSTITIAVINKNDETIRLSVQNLEYIKANHDHIVKLSAKQKNIKELSDLIGNLYGTGVINLNTAPIIWERRHKIALTKALELLNLAKDALITEAPLDAACTLCESALSEIAMLDGREVSDSIINGIFEKFCVGK